MANGINLTNKIDVVLNELKLTRKDFALKIGMPPSTLSSWKATKSLPSADALEKLAINLEVSTDWLISEEDNFEDQDSLKGAQSRKNIRVRIYELLGTKFKDEDTRFKGDYLTDEALLEELHNHYFTPGISYRLFYNWSKGRCEIPIDIFQHWSFTFNTSLDYIFTGSKNKAPNNFDSFLYEVAEKFRYQLYALENYSDERKSHAVYILDELFKQQIAENEKNKDKK